jgi:hypothetical protein
MPNLTWTKKEKDSIKKLLDSAVTGNEMMSLLDRAMEQKNQKVQSSN